MSQAMLTKSYQRDRDDAAFASLCELAKVSVEVVHAKHGNAAVCAARRAIATELRDRGWTASPRDSFESAKLTTGEFNEP